MQSRSTEPLLLAEYGVSDPVALTREDLTLLRALPADRFSVLATDQPGWVRVRATSWVGTVELSSRIVRVVPKVPDLRNVLMMMTASSGLTDWSATDVGYSTGELVEGVAGLILRSIDAATRRGLVHGYQEHEDKLQVIRGRLLVGELAGRPWEVAPAPCRYEEFTADVAENQVLKACVAALSRWALAPELRREVRHLLSRFEGIAMSPYPLHALETVRTTPVNEHYQSALALTRLVFEGASALHAAGGLQGNAFLVDMNALYESWIGAELARRLWPSVDVVDQQPVSLSTQPHVGMRPDLVFKLGKKVAAVADVKYKLTSSGISRTDDYYQLLAYTTVLGLERGTLIYCQSDEAPEKEITVVRGGQRLQCYPLGLGGDWSEVSARLDLLAEVFRRDAREGTAAHVS